MINYGRLAEKRAANYLRQKGYYIICGNYQTRFGEIDIIAEDGEYIVFVEVKMRNENSIATPAEFVDSNKQKRIIAASAQYLASNKIKLQPRFDVVEVFSSGNEIKSYKHLENAFGLV